MLSSLIGTLLNWWQDINLVLGYYILLWRWVPNGTHLIWGQHIDLVLDYSVLLGWWVRFGTFAIWGQHIDHVEDFLLGHGEFLMELLLSNDRILTSCYIIMSYLGAEFPIQLVLSVAAYWPSAIWKCLTWVMSSLFKLMLFEGSTLTSC